MVTNRDIATCIILSIFTCGIYAIYWFISLTDELNALSGVQDTSGGTAFLLTLVTCGIYGLYWAYKCGEKIDRIQMQRGINAGNNGVLYLILFWFGGIIACALIQNEINKCTYR